MGNCSNDDLSLARPVRRETCKGYAFKFMNMMLYQIFFLIEVNLF